MNSGERSGRGARERPRRGTLLIGIAAATALLTAGCATGQAAETSHVVSDVAGTSAQANVADSAGTTVGTVAVRNVFVVYKDTAGYPQGGTAPLEAWIFNDTPNPVTATVSSPAAASIALAGGAPAPAAPAAAPASLTIPAGGFAALTPGQTHYLQLVGLTKPLPVGYSVPLTFDFGGGVTINVDAPMGPPATPLPRSTPEGQTSTGR